MASARTIGQIRRPRRSTPNGPMQGYLLTSTVASDLHLRRTVTWDGADPCLQRLEASFSFDFFTTRARNVGLGDIAAALAVKSAKSAARPVTWDVARREVGGRLNQVGVLVLGRCPRSRPTWVGRIGRIFAPKTTRLNSVPPDVGRPFSQSLASSTFWANVLGLAVPERVSSNARPYFPDFAVRIPGFWLATTRHV